MTPSQRLLRQLLAEVPDLPANVDTRGVLLEGPDLFGGPGGCVAVHRDGTILAAIGQPTDLDYSAAVGLAQPGAELVATGEAIAASRRYFGIPGAEAIVHVLGPGGLRYPAGLPSAQLLPPSRSFAHLPEALRGELEGLAVSVPVAAVFEGSKPVAFCYPILTTEHFWDVSIETLDGFRRGGRAAAAFLRLERELQGVGLRPVWGAAVDNRASLALAAKLGFVAVGELVVFDSL